MGEVVTASGSKIEIGPAVAASASDTLAEMQALTGWIPVGLAETLGEFGDEATSVKFSSLSDARVRKAKGVRDAGTMALTVGRDTSDPGQDALVAAEGTNNKYPFKVTYPDRLTPNGTDSIEYFRALVLSKRTNIGGADNIIRRSFSLDIDSEIFAVDAT